MPRAPRYSARSSAQSITRKPHGPPSLAGRKRSRGSSEQGLTLSVLGERIPFAVGQGVELLAAAGRDVTFVDIRADADLTSKVPAWLAATSAEALVNKRSTTWRGLDDATRAEAEGDAAAALLVAHPTLIKRPVIEAGEIVHVGWTAAVSDALT